MSNNYLHYRRKLVEILFGLRLLDKKEWRMYLADMFDCSQSAILRDINLYVVIANHGYRSIQANLRLRNYILTRDHHTCQYCGQINLVFPVCDHVITCIKGGYTKSFNLVCACRPCNRKKGDKVWTPNNIDILALENYSFSLKIINASVKKTHLNA